MCSSVRRCNRQVTSYPVRKLLKNILPLIASIEQQYSCIIIDVSDRSTDALVNSFHAEILVIFGARWGAYGLANEIHFLDKLRIWFVGKRKSNNNHASTEIVGEVHSLAELAADHAKNYRSSPRWISMLDRLCVTFQHLLRLWWVPRFDENVFPNFDRVNDLLLVYVGEEPR